MMANDEPDKVMDAALTKALGPGADDTAPLSRAVLTRLADTGPEQRRPLAEVLADPRPAVGGMLAALLFAGFLGYALVPTDLQEAMAAYVLATEGC